MQKSSLFELLFCYAMYVQKQGISAFYSLAMTLPNTCFLTGLNFDIAITTRSPMLKSLSLHCDEYVHRQSKLPSKRQKTFPLNLAVTFDTRLEFMGWRISTPSYGAAPPLSLISPDDLRQARTPLSLPYTFRL